jgi:hypothetical protein
VQAAFLQADVSTNNIFIEIDKQWYRLKKQVYGLADSSLVFYQRFKNMLRKNGMEELQYDQCVFRGITKNNIRLSLHVDDALIADNHLNLVHENINKDIVTTDLLAVDTFLGVSVDRRRNRIVLHQKDYVDATAELAIKISV